MSWLNVISPIILHQSSDIPYVIAKDGVKLCFSNFYVTERSTGDSFSIEFGINKKKLERQSATYYRLKTFPALIPFSDIIKLDSIVLNGKIIKKAMYKETDTASVIVIKSSRIDDMKSNALTSLAEKIDKYDKAFLLVSDEIGENSRLLIDDCIPVYGNEWTRVATSIAHTVCPLKGRKYCWTQSCPDMEIFCYGFKTSDISVIEENMSYIGVPACNVYSVDL